MKKVNKEELIKKMNGALKLREEINKFVDDFYERGFTNICWLGIGGTYASSMQAVVHMKEKTALETFYQNAAEYLTTGNKRITDKTLVVTSSVTGNTKEVVEAVSKMRDTGITVLGFIDNSDADLASMVSYCISYPENEQLKFFMVADRLMYLEGEFPDYEEFYQEMNEHFAEDIANIEANADTFAMKFAEEHHDDKIHYFVGAGNQWGATYSYAMCYWEEQHWIRTRAVEAAEFFHGMFEVIDRDTPVTVYVGEDSQRKLSERVANFLPQICGKYTIIDTKDYDLPGISEKFRGTLSPFVFHAINNRIDVNIEHINRHPMDIRRYYRALDY
ncbi:MULTISPECIES: SIS domain-containing protein [Pediococcus]|jgi:fructoselysine-6-phosphate deglycase|uniref:SIS domain-containing protein n=1 Tax=Pediococcus TaxID=1253 RepID=UPI00003CE000|nr:MULTISPECIES: SIS domain-containing protein [Pediococcus]MCI1525260.1 SIS domain-containing protein [Lactobacillus crispatus]KAF5438711.1 SIS domain-containing protein [Pediococcus sp. EKM202D]KAF5438824.1 SIS domain-containing protein [Pediococcus sp. EKM201D]MCI1593889.1 SIS domain-containing protein [Pediococcus pentosaceus]MCT3019983.1 SIS domain-containing protein [Pediococcus pentosaceus]